MPIPASKNKVTRTVTKTKPCAMKECRGHCRQDEFLCAYHYRCLPIPMRRALYTGYAAGDRTPHILALRYLRHKEATKDNLEVSIFSEEEGGKT